MDIKILLVKVTGAPKPVIPFSLSRVNQYFLVWDINVTFSWETVDLPKDPTLDDKAIEALRSHYAPNPFVVPPPPALMILAGRSIEGPDINGMLLDTAQRGILAIYTDSNTYRGNDLEKCFQIVVHEIGHLLNLTHSDTATKYSTAMNSDGQRETRLTKLPEIWEGAASEMPEGQRPPLLKYRSVASTTPMGLPFAPRASAWLRTQARSVYPWGSNFQDTASQSHDTAALVEIQLKPLSRQLAVGWPFDFSVSLNSSQKTPEAVVHLPVNIGFKEDVLQLTITDPDGESRRYMPPTKVCGGKSRVLTPGKSVVRRYSLLRDLNGLLFPKSGKYEVRVSMPSLGSESKPLVLDVREPVGPFQDIGFRNFLAQPVRGETDPHWETVSQAIDDESLPIGVRAHLAHENYIWAAADSIAAGERVIEKAEFDSPRTFLKHVTLRLARATDPGQAEGPGLVRMAQRAREILSSDDPDSGALEAIQQFIQRKHKGSKQ